MTIWNKNSQLLEISFLGESNDNFWTSKYFISWKYLDSCFNNFQQQATSIRHSQKEKNSYTWISKGTEINEHCKLQT